MTEPRINLSAQPAPDRSTGETYGFPSSAAQRGFWILDQLDPGNPACNIAVRFRLRGPLDVGLLETSVNAIVRRHETLRTRFSLCGGELLQIVEPELAVKVKVHELRILDQDDQPEEIERISSQEARDPFDPTVLPLIRVSLIRIADEESNLLATIHHAVCDGWSIGIFVEEVTAFYDSCVEGIAPRLPALPLQYADYAIWQNEQIASGAFDSQVAYWRNKLLDAPRLSLRTDFARGSRQTFRSEIQSILLRRELTNGLLEISRISGCTLFVTILAAFQILLSQLSGQQDIVIGTLAAGRPQEELERLLGVFVNSLVLRTDLSGDPTFTDLLERSNDTVVQSFQNQDVPFDLVVKAVNPPRDERSHPLFQVHIIYQRDFVRAVRFGGVEVTAIPSRPAGSPYDLNLFLVERADGWRASIEYDPALFKDVTVLSWLRRLETILGQVRAAPDQPISSLIPGLIEPITKDPSDQVPRAELEVKLKHIWERVLACSRLGVHDNFFECGGHSLLATALLAEIRKECGIQLRLADFVNSPTVARMAAAIASGESANTPSVVAIQSKGSKPPLFLVHGVGGTVVGLGLLSKHLGQDQPVYAVQSPSLREADSLPTTVEEMATRYIKEILAVRPSGPFLLLGYSLGGLIAFEIAQQFRAMGCCVGMLGMLDTFQLGYWRNVSARVSFRKRSRSCFRVIRLHLERLAAGPGRIDYLMDRIGSKYVSLLYRFRADRAGTHRLGTVDHLNWYAARKYVARPYPDNMILFRAMERGPDEEYDYLLGWGGMAKGGIEVYDIPGGHEEMGNEPNIQVLARAVEFCILKSELLSCLSVRFPPLTTTDLSHSEMPTTSR